MANVKTYDLLQCSRLFPTVSGSNNISFLPFIDSFIEINSEPTQSYEVKENVQARFFAPTSADVTSNVMYSVSSIQFNGLECMSTPANITIEETDNIYIEFPNYISNPTGYSSNLADAVYNTDSLVPTPFFERNFVDFIQSLFDNLGVNAEIVNSHPDWLVVDGFPSMKNFMVECYSSDSLRISITEIYNGASRDVVYEVNPLGAFSYINGVDVTLIPVPINQQPQFGDVYSINSFTTVVNSVSEIECCPVVNPFYASLVNNCGSTLNVDCDCSNISFSDTSNYNNGLVNHDPSLFNHRTITMTRPDGTQYIWSTDGVVGQIHSSCGCSPIVHVGQVVNKIITPHWNSNNTFNYDFLGTDSDGIYTVKICTYPDWVDGEYYDFSLGYFVYRNGVIYRQISSSTGIDPELDTEYEFWIPAEADYPRGRYCSEQKIVVLCISILDCYKKLVEKALCDIKSNPCSNMCDNLALMNSLKVRVTLDALETAVCHKKWDLVKDHLAILKSICCCNG